MKTIHHAETREELINRILLLDVSAKPNWGKMTVYQMVKHCTMSEELFQGKISFKRLFIGRLFGKMALTALLKDAAPMKKNQPTHKDMKITENGDFRSEQLKWIELLKAYSQLSNSAFVHPFFGSMTKDQIGKYVYKHTDHHLRQFGC